MGSDMKTLTRKIKSLKNSLDISNDYAKKLEARVRLLNSQKKALIDEEKRKNEKQRRNIIEGKEVVMRDSLIKNLAIEVQNLRKKISKIDELEMIAKDGRIPVVQIDRLEKESIFEKDRIFGLNGAVITANHKINSHSAIRMLISLQPKAVIADLDENTARTLIGADIYVIKPGNVSLRKYFEFLGIDRTEFEREIKRYKY